MRNVYGQSTATYRVNWFYKLPNDNPDKELFTELNRKDKTFSEVQVIMSVISKLTNSKLDHSKECNLH